ncbi:MAG: hypothetical protein ABIC82_05285 [bacterium]
MIKVHYKLNKIIIIVLNFIYLIAVLATSLILHEYIYGIYSDYSRFKITHSPMDILRDTIAILLWIIFSIFIYQYNKKSISKNRVIMAYSAIPFMVMLVVYYIVAFSHV